MDVLELQATGLEPIGTWSVIDSLNLTRMVEIELATNPYNGVFHLLASNLTKKRVHVYSHAHVQWLMCIHTCTFPYKNNFRLGHKYTNTHNTRACQMCRTWGYSELDFSPWCIIMYFLRYKLLRFTMGLERSIRDLQIEWGPSSMRC